MSRRGFRAWPTAALVALAACLTTDFEPISEDRSAIVTIDDFADRLGRLGLALESDVDRLEKRKLLTAWELSYEFEGRGSVDAGGGIGIALRSETAVHRNEPTARHAYDSYRTGLGWGMRKNGVSMRPLPSTLAWGPDVALFALDDEQGRQIGNGLVTRRGRAASYALVVGLYWSDSSQFERALFGKLGSLDRYDPGAPADDALAGAAGVD
jgi:hypothetical protein